MAKKAGSDAREAEDAGRCRLQSNRRQAGRQAGKEAASKVRWKVR